MAQNWTTSDLSLTVTVPPGPRFGARLQAALREAVRDRRLHQGDALPSTRDLAAQLGVARGTVVSAYEQLIAEGYLVAHAGGRTRVAASAAAPTRQATGGRIQPRVRFDLRPGVPDLRSFPAADWAWAYAEASRRVRSADLDYGDGRGHAHAREVVAAHLRRVRAADADADALVMANGFAQSVSLAMGVLAARGVRTLAVEDPGDRSADAIARAAGIRPLPLPVDDEGIRVDLLTAAAADAVLVTPAHQSPTGAVLSAERRIALSEWASASGGWIIEDDYDSEFRYDRQPVGSLQGLAPDRVILIGSASKTHAPGVRVGWMAVPPSLVGELAAARMSADRGGSVIDQLAFAHLVESGRHDRHVRAMRGVYSARRERLVAALARGRSGLTLTGLSAGFHGVLAMPSGADVSAMIAAGRARSMRLTALNEFVVDRRDLVPALVIGFGNIDDEDVAEATGVLEELLAAQ